MDPKLVAIIENYARTHGLNLPPHQIVSDMVASGPSGVEQLLAMLGMSVNAVYLARSRVLRCLRLRLQGLLD